MSDLVRNREDLFSYLVNWVKGVPVPAVPCLCLEYTGSRECQGIREPEIIILKKLNRYQKCFY